MLEFGKHTAFIYWSYGISGAAILAMIAYSYKRGRK